MIKPKTSMAEISLLIILFIFLILLGYYEIKVTPRWLHAQAISLFLSIFHAAA